MLQFLWKTIFLSFFRDVNSEIGENCIETLMYQHNLLSVYKQLLCYGNLDNMSYVDLFLINTIKSF